MIFCECEVPYGSAQTEERDGLLVHISCGQVVECTFSYLNDDPHPATSWEMDYHICETHRAPAIDNISTREWYT
jgi:hypothetical protein